MTATLLPRGGADKVMDRLFPKPNPYLEDPDGWARDVLGVESWSKPKEIRDSVVVNRHTAVPAAHDCAKSHTAASIACWWIDVHPPGEAIVVSTAPVHHQVQAILWSEISSMHARAGLAGRLTGLTGTSIPEWYIDGRRVGFGRTPDKMESFQGIHNMFVLVIIDEGGGVPEWLFRAADALATNANSRVLCVGNPDDPTAHFAEICEPGSKWNVIPISAYDTPRFTCERQTVSAELLERLVSQEYVDETRALGEDSHIYQSKVLGHFPDVSSDALFPPRMLQKAIDADLAGTARGGFGVDIARYGPDETVVYRNRGGVIRLVAAARQQDTEETADLVETIMAKFRGIPAVLDAVGLGVGVFDKLRRRGLPVIDFNGGERAYEPDLYVNRRAETYWTLRLMMDDGLIDLDPDDKELLAQLGRLKWKPISGGRIQIESKDDMRKRGVKSPDRADAIAMALSAPAGRLLDDFLAQPNAQQPHLSLTGDLMDREF